MTGADGPKLSPAGASMQETILEHSRRLET